MALRRFIRDSALYGAANLLARGIVFLLLPIYTQVLTPGEVGAFEWLSAASLTLMALLPLEVTQALARLRTQDSSAEDIRRQARTALGFTLLMLGGFAALVVLLAITLQTGLLVNMPAELLISAALLLLVNGWFYFVQNELRWSGRADWYALGSIVAAIVTAATAVLMLLVIEAGILGLYGAMILGSSCGAAIAMCRLPHLLRPRLRRGELFRLLQFSFPLAISSTTIILATTVDRLLVAQYISLEALGVYGVAIRVAGISILIFQGFQLAVLPTTVGQGQAGRREVQIERSFRAFLLIAINGALLLSAVSPMLLALMAAPAYASAQIYVPVLLVGAVAGAAYPFAPGLWLTGRSRAMAVLGLLLVLVGLGLSSWLVPWVGVMGAAMAYSATGLIYATLMFWASDRVFPVARIGTRIGWVVALFILAAALQTWAAQEGWPVALRIAAVLITLPATVWLLTTQQDRQQFTKLIRVQRQP
jgi:O-antigen/teichoic acid export membrane protein